MRYFLYNTVTVLAYAYLFAMSSTVYAGVITSPQQSNMATGNCNEHPNQTINITNGLVNTQIPANLRPGMTVTAVTFIDYDETGNVCWTESAKLFYGQTISIYSGNDSCGCKLISKIDVIPIARRASDGYPEDPKTVYQKISIPITKSDITVMELIQEQPPAFDVQSGLISNQGTMTFKKTNYQR